MATTQPDLPGQPSEPAPDARPVPEGQVRPRKRKMPFGVVVEGDGEGGELPQECDDGEA